MRMPLTVLVTGGSGFIGSHVVDRLIAAGHRPRILDLRPSPYHAAADVPTTIADLADLAALTSAMAGCDAVVHLAAAADVGEVEKDPVTAEERNARGTVNVLEAARQAGVGRVLYASTVWVYSDTDADEHVEDLPLHPPAHLYSATKLAGELYCRGYRELYGVETTVLRFGIPYGPRARPAAVVPAFVRQALAGEPITVAGDGSQSRRFVYVEDLAEGVVAALAPVAANRVYNLVGEEDTSIAEIAETVRSLVADVEIRRVPGRTGDFRGAPASGARAAAELGWRPRTPFREGVRRYVEWHRAQDGAATGALAAPEPRRPALVPLLRRFVLAAVLAAVAGIGVLGLASLVPVDQDLDAYDTFTATLVLLLPLALTGGFDWDAAIRRRLGAVCWTVAAAEVAVAAGLHTHRAFLLLSAVTAAVAALLARHRGSLQAMLAGAGDA